MLRDDWNPSELAVFEGKYKHLAIPADGRLDSSEAGRWQLMYEIMLSDLTTILALAHWYEKNCKFKRDHEYTIAFRTSNGKSDRQREADAKSALTVQAAEAKLSEAEVYRAFISNKREDGIRVHHALKLIARGGEESRFIG